MNFFVNEFLWIFLVRNHTDCENSKFLSVLYLHTIIVLVLHAVAEQRGGGEGNVGGNHPGHHLYRVGNFELKCISTTPMNE